MTIEIINTGAELMLGRILNSHHQWLCRALADRGYVVSRQTAVPDSASDIAQAVRESLARSDFIITTGGLGPTSDDLTRESVARLLGRSLREHQETLNRIKDFFEQRNRPMPESTRVQALVPEGALVLGNAHGTAPGLAIELAPNPYRATDSDSWLVMLPGPPRELHPMFNEQIIPLLERMFPLKQAFALKNLRTTGLGESMLEERIAGGLRQSVAAGLEVGYCARPGQVDVRLLARGVDCTELVRDAEQSIRRDVGSGVFGEGDDELEEIVVRLLTQRNQTLALAESCTGGCVANRLTNVAGVSAVFLRGLVTYSNEAKQQLLAVKPETLAAYGAVSEPVAREMAQGARQLSRSHYALAITGIAGPTGGTPEKPVGTVFIALASDGGTDAWKFFNPWDRLTFKDVTASQALNQLRLLLERNG